MNKYVVIDTNVIISSVLSSKGNPANIMRQISDENVLICYNAEILDEYERVLAYPKFKFSIEEQKEVIEKIRENGIMCTPSKTSNIEFVDESDRIFYDIALETGATLITGNTKHFPNESFIMNPAEYIEHIHQLERPSRERPSRNDREMDILHEK